MTEQERRDLEEFRRLMAQLPGKEKAVKACLLVLKGKEATV